MADAVDIKNVPPDVENPYGIVTVYNPNDEDFVFHWDGKEYRFLAKKETQMVKFVAIHGAHHLAKQNLLMEAKQKEIQFKREFPKEDNPNIGGVQPEEIKKLSDSLIKDPNKTVHDKMAKARAARGTKPKKEEIPFADLNKNF